MVLLLVKFRSMIGRLTALIVWTRKSRRYSVSGDRNCRPGSRYQHHNAVGGKGTIAFTVLFYSKVPTMPSDGTIST